jgi:precorrin-6Y C5,15-methyltransferase (decarboxylating)
VTAWLHIIGVGEAGVAALPPATRLILSYAETVRGPTRFLTELEDLLRTEGRPSEFSANDNLNKRNLEAVARALLDEDERDDDDEAEPTEQGRDDDMPQLVEWDAGLDRMVAQVMRLRDTPTVILASGDPMWFGIGATLARHLANDEFEIHPHPSAFQLAAAAMRWPLQNVATMSLHARPVELVHPLLTPGNRILALTSDADTAHDVADLLVNRGFSNSTMTILENLGGSDERVSSALAVDLDISTIGDFYVLAIDCVAAADTMPLPPLPGLPDAAFVSDGQLTKREIRAATVVKLAPMPGQLLWDVGAGCGSVAIEWMRAARDAEAIAFERDEERQQMIVTNASALGVPWLRIEGGEAPGSLAAMPAPDAVFLGGSVADDGIFSVCWDQLKPGGRMVANAVTVDGELALFTRQARHGGDLVRLETSVLDTVGEQKVMRPRMAVLQWSAVKPSQWLSVLE